MFFPWFSIESMSLWFVCTCSHDILRNIVRQGSIECYDWLLYFLPENSERIFLTCSITLFLVLCVEMRLISFLFFSFAARELKICSGMGSGGEVCCSADMELQLQARARDKHDKAIKEHLMRILNLMSTRSTRFDCKFFFQRATLLSVCHKNYCNTWRNNDINSKD